MGRCLTLLDVQSAPLAAIASACGGSLESLQIRGCLSTSSIEAVSKCLRLKTLKLSLEPKVVADPFIRVFTACRQLRVVDIYSATDVSDQTLACIMLHLPDLEDFCGSYSTCSRGLTDILILAFKSHFSRARRIVVDDLVTDSLL